MTTNLITITPELKAAIQHMIDNDNDYVPDCEALGLPAGSCIVNRFDGTAALMATHGSCNMLTYTLLQVL